MFQLPESANTTEIEKSTEPIRADEIKKLDNVARTTKDANSVRLVNHKYVQFQRGFVSQGGLPDREFYKHVVLAPGLDTGKHLLPQIMVNLKM